MSLLLEYADDLARQQVSPDYFTGNVYIQPVATGLLMTKSDRHEGLPEVEMLWAQETTVRSDKPIRAHADGEPVRGLSFDISIVPGALTIMTPA